MTVRRLPLLQDPLLVRNSALGAVNTSFLSHPLLLPTSLIDHSPSPHVGVKHVYKARERERESGREGRWDEAS